MNSQWHNDQFEDFLQQQARQHRMYPSDQLWRNIQDTIHGNRRWPALTFISIFIIVSLVITTLVVKPNQHVIVVSNQTMLTAEQSQRITAENNRTVQQTLAAHLSPDNITRQTIAVVSKISGPGAPGIYAYATAAPAKQAESLTLQPAKSLAEKLVKPDASILKKSVAVTEHLVTDDVKETGVPAAVSHHIVVTNPDKTRLFALPLDWKLPSTEFDNYSAANWKSSPSNKSVSRSLLSRLSFQFYATPSVSYRRLVDQKTGKAAHPFLGVPASANYTIDVNQVVRHSPAMGAEVGFALGYALNNSLTLTAGFQFNIRQYNIEAYKYNYEPASVALFSRNTSDTLNTYSIYRNYPSGSSPIVLKNRYYELSVPIGLDWKVISFGKLGIHVAGSVQPTYTFDKEPFIITSDYKHYADGSLLMRKWNLNTSMETYVSYQAGSFKWQIGPQFRYQQLPTLSDKYPIREYLLDYGIKIGFTKSIK